MPAAGICYENGSLDYAKNVGHKGGLNNNVNFRKYLESNHPYSIDIYNRLELMSETQKTFSLSKMDVHSIWLNIVEIIELSKAKGVKLTAVMSDEDDFIEKIKFIAFDLQAPKFAWHFDWRKDFRHFPNQLFDKLSKKINENIMNNGSKFDILPIQLIISTMPIPQHKSKLNDIQFHLTPKNKNYTILTFSNDQHIVYTFIELDSDEKDEIEKILKKDAIQKNPANSLLLKALIVFLPIPIDDDDELIVAVEVYTKYTGILSYMFAIETIFSLQNDQAIRNILILTIHHLIK